MKQLTPLLRPLKGFDSFDKVFKEGYRVKSKNAFAVFIISNSKEQEFVNYGIGISKRTAKKAVVRNRLKRLIRESLVYLSKNESDKLLLFEKFVIIWTSAPSHAKLINLKDVQPVILDLFNNAVKTIEKERQ